MSVVEITDPESGARASVAVEAGFNCFRFDVPHGEDVLNVLASEDEFEFRFCFRFPIGFERVSSAGTVAATSCLNLRSVMTDRATRFTVFVSIARGESRNSRNRR